MDNQLNNAPCGFLTLSEEGIILSINQTLSTMLSNRSEKFKGLHINSILVKSAQIFFQFYFFPLLKLEGHIEELYSTLLSENGEEIPVLINAVTRNNSSNSTIDCIIIPIRKRNELEHKLLQAKKTAEEAYVAKHHALDELKQVYETLEAKQEELLELYNLNQKYKIETKKELELARKIQETPLTEPIYQDDIKIDSFYQASKELSGDIYGFYQIDDNRYGIIILDVMGHGISSALITMSLHSLFRRIILRGFSTDMVMKELDNHLNTLFKNNEEARHYCTSIYLIVDTNKREIHYTNAGHPPAIWQQQDGEQFYLHATNPPIGTFEGLTFKSNMIKYEIGGYLLLYTDGVADPLGDNHLGPLIKANQFKPFTVMKNLIIDSLNPNTSYHKSDDQCFVLAELS
ncbi:SpoIIE family protein phosphatase [Metabacillus malikii]|uniref:Sigma-B regulation protein RsbU (Phosphoserine phosphatase) n=1 Tax=Metabacillus malikii TaxID=1504265 RepID=A0ABT9ZF41_9BACI|nr:SpoIIE family protein phosphatase [Metabacillus malikii]MDQ0230867.1 sigma-B regulation protein RsbU (phosphoserine phosphatase) [Metabacillus malikii]